MIKLMKLELKKVNIRPYVYGGVAIMVVMIGLLFLFAYAPKLEPNDPDLLLFFGYSKIISLYGVVHMSVFAVLSSIMFSRFVSDEYLGKASILLFSYPIQRRKLFCSKILIVTLFITFFMVLSSLISYLVFGLIEWTIPIVNSSITLPIILHAVRHILVMVFAAISIGIIATGIGFIKNSLPTTIISALILSSLLCNIVAGSLDRYWLVWSSTAMFVIIGGFFTLVLLNKINKMEVE